MTRGKMLILAGALAVASVLCLAIGISTARTIQSYVKDRYQNVGYNTYRCSGSPSAVADDLARAHRPEARATDRGNYYLRYSNSIAIVGAGSGQSCTIRLENLNSGYNHGSYVFLGPGFSPGSPSHSSGGSSGGPGGVK